MREYQSAEIKDLAAALVKAQDKIGHAKKSAENPAYKKDGKASLYADLPAVIDIAKPHLISNGLSVVQMTDIDANGDAMLVTQITHTSGQWMRGYYPLKPSRPNDPQALGGAVTYARRYAYCGMTGVVAEGEDDDGNIASAVNEKQTDKAPEANNLLAEFDKLAASLSTCNDLTDFEKKFLDENVARRAQYQGNFKITEKQLDVLRKAVLKRQKKPVDDVPAYLNDEIPY